VAAATAALLDRRPPTGLYHCVNTGSASWHDLAVEVRRQLRVEAVLEPITMADLRLPAARPQYCALANDKLRQVGIAMPPWQDALGRALSERRTTPNAEWAEPRNVER
jgi:dTDP-4-dehydrorhamnose reductase